MSEIERQILIKLTDNEFEVVTEDRLREMESDALKFDGFQGWRVVGYCDELTKGAYQ
ncbi:MAG: hypothetical protein RIE52_12050 [Balneola sp.]